MLISIIEKHERKPKCCAECDLFVPRASDYGYCPITEEGYDEDEQLMENNPDCPLKKVGDDVLQS